jgi:hypothetical protein
VKSQRFIALTAGMVFIEIDGMASVLLLIEFKFG